MKIFTYSLVLILGLFVSPIFLLSQNNSSQSSVRPNENIEIFVAKLKAQHIFKKIQERTGATKEEVRLFAKFYQDSIIVRDRSHFVQAVLHGKIKTDADVKVFAAKIIPEYVAMYYRFEALRKNAPSVVTDKLVNRAFPPTTCDTGCNNKDFSDGTLANWTACYSSNTSIGTSSSSGSSGSFSNSGWTCFGPLAGGTVSAFDPSTSSNQVSITSGPGLDPIAGALIPVVAPGGGPYSCRIGDSTNPNYGMAMIEQTFMVSASEPYFNFAYAVLLENPNHPYYEQPYFEIIMLDQNGDTIPGCGQYYVVSGPGLPGYTSIYYPTNLDTVYAKPWTMQYVSLRSYIGTCITIQVIAADCAAGAHFGYGYFDAFCSAIVPISSSPAVCGTSNVTLTAPPGASSYQWIGPPCFTGPTNTQTTTVNCSGTYSVIVVSNLANPCPDTLSISIIAAPAFNFNLLSTTNNICNGDSSGSASAVASAGTSPYTYSWSQAVGTNPSASNLSAGTYTIYARDYAGCNDSLVVTITQPPAIAANIAITQPPCGSNSGAVSISAAGGAPAYTYLWSNGSSSSSVTGLSAGNYSVTVTDADGCTVTSTAVVSTLTPLTVTATITNIACSGGSSGTATANASNGTNPYTYSWSPSGGTNVTATGLSAGTYTIFVTDINGCSGFTSVIIVQSTPMAVTTTATPTGCAANTGTATVNASGGTPAYTYSWSPSNNTNANATGLSAGVYTITVTDANGCTITATTTVNQPSSLTISTTTSPSNCGGSNGSAAVNVTGGTPVYTYAWAPTGGSSASASGLSAGTYTVTVTDANGCFQTAAAVVGAGSSQPLTVGVSGGASLCSGSYATLIATANGGFPPYSFLWTPGGMSTQSITVAPSVTTTYTIQLTDGCGTIVTDTVTVFINPSPLVSFRANPASGCAPLCIQFYNTTTITSGYINLLRWNMGNGDTLTGKEPIYCFNNPGSYNITLTATSDKGCSSSLTHTDMINVYPRPLASFTYSPQPVSILTPLVQFTDNSTSQNPLIYWNWQFGDAGNTTSSLKNPSYLYPDTGTFCVTLYVGDTHGCVDTATNCLVVEPIFTIYIPDAFSPNGDGVNDVFMVKGSYVKDFEMYVFDRWGIELYHTTDIMKGWNGKGGSGSGICQEDAYIYEINLTDARGIKHSYTGTVNLLK